MTRILALHYLVPVQGRHVSVKESLVEDCKNDQRAGTALM